MSTFPVAIDPELDLVLERTIDVSAAQVWEAWTTPESIKHWFAPKPYETPEVEVDLRPGGAFRSVMKSPDGELMDNTGVYLEIVPGERLVWTSALAPGFRPQPHGFLPFTAVLSLEALGDHQTKYTAIAIHQDAAGAQRHREMGFHDGWGQVLDQLVAHVTSSAG